jgi:serine-type D-Ala-D-Ala carboxypeptidase/endopeptidase (penicillin-binding protein 4)
MIRSFFLIFLLIPALSFALDDIEQALKPYPELNVSIQLKDLKTGKEIYSRNPYQLMTPASVTKSFTTYAALKYLTPNFTYKTDILEKDGNLYFKFSGDPTLTKEDLSKLIAKLKKQPIKQVFIDSSIFDQIYKSDGQPWDDGKFCYAAPVSAIVINKNCFRAIFKPAETIGTLAKLNSSSTIFANINNNVLTKKDPTCCPDLVANPDNSYNLNGCINLDSETLFLNVAYQNPELMLKGLIKKLLEEKKLAFSPKINFKKTPPNAKLIASHTSVPISEIAKKMHKISDNLMADNLLKTIGTNYYKTQGNFKNGTKAMLKILLPLDLSKTRFKDGSGISRYNLISAKDLVNLFTAAYQDKNIWPSFEASLPISSTDGTLERRFLDYPDLRGKIRAKTGYMGGVNTLAGYINQDKVFAIMINGNIESTKIANQLSDSIVAILAKQD